MANMLFGNAFTAARIHAKKRQGEIARLIGMDASYLAGIESGRRKAPNPETTKKLLNELDISVRQQHRLRTLAIIDRLLDVIEGYEETDETAKRIEKLLRQLAEFGDKEWNSLEWAASALVHQLNQQKEELT